MSPILNLKLEMITLAEEGTLRAKIGPTLGLSWPTVSQVVNAKGKFWKEIKSTTPVNTRMRKTKQPYC